MLNQNNGEKPDPKMGSSLGVVINQYTGEIPFVFNIAHKDPKAKIIGGRIEKGETPLVALIREIREETGLKISPDKAMSLFSVLADNKKHYYHVFACIVDNFDGLHRVPVKDGKDLLEVRVFSENEIAKTPMLLQHRVILKQAIQKIRGE